MNQLRLESCEVAPGTWTVRVQGEVDSSNVAQLKGAFDQIFSRKIYRIVVHLKDAKYVASSGIGCLVGAFTTAIKNGGRIVFSATPLQIMEVFSLIGLSQILRFAPDEKAALEHFT